MTVGVGLGLESRNILGHRTGQKLDVLRQIADVLAERFRRPLVECRAIETDFSPHRLPYADNHACN